MAITRYHIFFSHQTILLQLLLGTHGSNSPTVNVSFQQFPALLETYPTCRDFDYRWMRCKINRLLAHTRVPCCHFIFCQLSSPTLLDSIPSKDKYTLRRSSAIQFLCLRRFDHNFVFDAVPFINSGENELSIRFQ